MTAQGDVYDARQQPIEATIVDSESRRAPRPDPPAGLLVLSILSLILAVLGLLSGFQRIVGALFPALAQQASTAFAMSAEAAESQREMNRALLEATRPFQLWMFLVAVALVMLCVALLAGSIGCLRRRPHGPRILRRTMICGVLYEVANVVLVVLMLMSNMSIMAEQMPRVMSSAGGAGQMPLPPAFFQFVLYAGMMIQGVWTAIKVVFYCVGARYLRTEKVAAACGAPRPRNSA